jgi:hypothetical protein
MDLELIGNLIRLRYKLLWANARTRPGRRRGRSAGAARAQIGRS